MALQSQSSVKGEDELELKETQVDSFQNALLKAQLASMKLYLSLLGMLET